MLQLTRMADYGLRLMLDLGANPQDVTPTAGIAQRQEIPHQFLRKIAQTLVSRGLVVSERGFRGGLRLARPPEEITVLDIVAAFDGPALNLCTLDPPRCARRHTCAIYSVWADAQAEVERVLGAARLSDLAKRQSALNRPRQRRACTGTPA